MKKMLSSDFVSQFLLGNHVSLQGLDLEGDVVIEGGGENQRLIFEDLDLENVDLHGGFRVRNCTFTGGFNLYHAQVTGDVIIENVTVDGDLSLPQNILELVDAGRTVILRNLIVKGDIQFSTP